MPEANDIEARLKEVETTVASFQAIIPDLRQFMHDEYESSENLTTAVAGLKRERDKGTDWIARGLALAAFAVATFAALTLHFKQFEMSQEANPVINVEPNTDAELEDQRIRELLHLEPRNAVP